jgi:cell division protein ZapA
VSIKPESDHAESDKAREVARVSVRILEKEYFVACPHEERSDLLDSAEYLNTKMREIRDSGKVVGLDRIAVIAALNLANELLRIRNKDRRGEDELGGRIRAMRERIDTALARGQQLEL